MTARDSQNRSQTLRSTLGFIARHPANRKRRVRAVLTFFTWQVWKRATGRPIVARFWRGLKVTVHPDSRSASLALYTGLPEYDDMLFTERFLRDTDFVIDVGANIGLYTMLAASRTRHGKVVAIEPHPMAAVRLRNNVELNRFQNVEAHAAAAGARPGEARLTTDLDTINHIVTGAEDPNAITVPMLTLDGLVAPGAEVALVKLDAEGFESAVLAGAKRILDDQAVLAWIVEVNGLGGRYGSDDATVLETFTRAGYRPHRYLADLNRLVEVSSPPTGEAEWNLIFVRDIDESRKRLVEPVS